MSIHRKLYHVLSIIVILTMLFSGVSLPTASAQGPDGIERQVNPQTGKVSFIGPESGQVLSAPDALGMPLRPQDPAMALAKRFGPEFGLKDPGRDLSEIKASLAENGRITARYQQNYQGIPVMGGELIVNTNKNGDLYSMNGEVSSSLSLSTQPKITLEQAMQTALEAVAKWYEKVPKDFVASEPELWIYDESLLRPSTRPVELVWRMEVTAKDAGMLVRELVLINAQRGNISLHFNQIDTAWTVNGSSGTVQDPTPTYLPTETASPTETSIPSETPLSTETSIPMETMEATATLIPTEEPVSTEAVLHTDSPASVAAFDGATWYVATAGNDSNSCSTSALPCATIQAAINKAASNDIIAVAAGSYSPVSISKSLMLLGGWNTTFTAQTSYSTIQGSATADAISTSGATVSISRFVARGNKYGIYHSAGTLSFDQGALIANRNGIYNLSGDTTFTNVTISGNQGGGTAGSAISNVSGTIRIQSSTITNNGGTEAISSRNGSALIIIGDSILAGNTGGDCNVGSGNMTSTGHNIFGRSPACSSSSSFIPDPTDQVGMNPQLSALFPVGYHPISFSGPAADQGNPASCPATDQRGVSRPQGSACDIGAYEYMTPGAAASFGIASGSNQHAGPSLPFQSPLAVYVIDASGSPVSGVNVTFSAPASGPSGMFANSGTNVSTVPTNSEGIAVTSMFTANSQLGNYNVIATVVGLPGSVSFALSNVSWFVSPTGSDANSCTLPVSPCLTLNGAIAKAANGDAIKVAEGTYAPASISKSLTLLGGWNSTFTAQTSYSTVQGSATTDGIATSGTTVSISRFVVQNSKYGIYHTAGMLRFEQGALIKNTHGLYNSSGDVTFTNATISGNQSSGISGSAISNSSGRIRIQHSTISNNSGPYAIHSTFGGAQIEIGNSILAGNSGADCNIGNTNMISTGHNIFGRSPACSGSTAFVPDPTDQVGTDPELFTLLPLGYHPLSATSPAMDAADPLDCPAADQRDLSRPQGSACDIGAYEYTAPGAAAVFGIASGSNQHSGPSLSFALPLAVYVVDNAGNPVSGATVTFTAPASGPSSTFAGTGTNTTSALTTEGIATSSVFTANAQLGSYNVTATVAGLPGSVSFTLTNAAWFVSPTGNNANSCDLPSFPCLTINGAIAKATNGDAIKVAVGTYGSVTVAKNLSLLGGWDSTFTSQTGYSTVQGSVTSHGISVSSQNIFISRFIVQNSNRGIYHNSIGTLHFDRGALINNTNGLYNSGGEVAFTNTTITGNQSSVTASGSAINNEAGMVRIQYSTITNNEGSIAVYSAYSTARIEIGNSILAGNSGEDCYVGNNANMTSTGHNIFGRSPACSGLPSFVPDPTDQVGIDPQLSPLLPFGYHPILSTSPAVDQGDPDSCPATDQRGVTRPQGTSCDIGAYEYAPSAAAASFGIASGTNQHSGPALPFQFPLIVYVIDEAGNPVNGVNVTFTAPVSGPGGTFADTHNNTTTATTNNNGLAISPVFVANSQTGSYAVTATVAGLPGSVSFALTNAMWFVAPTGSDANSCTLPSSPCLTISGAITKAVNGDAIRIAVGTYAPVSISKSLTFFGGWNTTFTSQIGYSTIQGSGGVDGISVSGQNVSISRFIVQNSYRGIYHSGTGILRFEQGALIRNSSGLYNNSGDTAFTNTTISGSIGIGINNISGTVSIQYSTITNNTGFYGINSTNDGAHIEIGNSILAGNSDADCYVGINNMTSTGHNIFGRSPACSGSTAFVPDPTDQVGVDPQLAVLFPGGYHPILSTSPALDQGNPAACPATDQRGVARPQAVACDIGAYEYMAPGAAASFGILSGSDQRSGPSLPFPLPLVVYVMDASGNPVSGVNVTFTAPATGPGGTFATNGTNVTTVPTNSGGVAVAPTFTANAQLGGYNVVTTAVGLPGSVRFALTNAAWFVAPTGSNGNSCNQAASPCLTINGAIAKAANGDAILVAAGMYTTIQIYSKSLTLLGGWDPAFSSRIGYSIVQGDPNSYGHAILVESKKVSISRFIVQNTYHGIYHGYGAGTLYFDQGAILNNSNGLRNMSGDVFLTNTTISGNYVHLIQGTYAAGSAISNVGGRIRIQHATITNNGGTEAIWSTNGSAQIEIGNSILAGNPGGDCDRFANITSVGHNLLGSSPPCGAGGEFVPQPTDQVGVDPKLFSIFPNGYHPLLPDSPAINAADPLGCPTVDQRGVTRPAGTACDIGAVEYSPTGTTPKYILAYQGSSQTILINSAASSRLVAVVFDQYGNSVPGKTVTFTAPASGASAVFANTGTNTTTVVTDVNGFATSPAFSANSIAGRYSVVATVNGADTPTGFSLINSSIALNPTIQTYTANNYVDLPGTFLCNQMNLACTNGRDIHADAAHKYAIDTYFLYAAEHNRNSIDNEGMPILSTVHFYGGYANAFWNGSQMVYGDAFGFALADDVVAHELTHGVTEYESNLFYYYQSGAINESFSDLWGEYYDQTNGMGNDSNAVRWLMGEDVSGLGALRSFSNPPDYGDPDKMSSPHYHTDTSDNGGVHHNSGVNNKAVFLMVNGGVFNGKTISPLSWQKTAAIYYEVNTNLLSSAADYSDLYYALQQACSNLVGQKGITATDCVSVKNAIDAVEMNSQPAPNFNTDAPYCDMGNPIATILYDGLESGRGNWTFNNGSYVRWQLDSPYGRYAHSGNHFLFADDYPSALTDASARLISVTVPDNAYLHFAHAYDFEAYEASGYYDDGGVLEYSINGGSTWSDAGPLIDFNGYKGTIRSGNPLQGRSAFVGASHGYISTRVNLDSLTGETVAFRWRMGLDSGGFIWGWWLDDVRIYQCPEPETTPPTVSSIARVGSEITGAANVDFTVTFSEPVVGVDVYDFSLNTSTTITGATVKNVIGSNNVYTVTVNTGSGNGTLRLDVPQTASITDLPGNLLAGLPFVDGQFYTINKVTDADIYIGVLSDPVGTYPLASGESTRQSFVGVNSGPVRIRSSNEIPIIASERIIYKVNGVNTSFSEMMGLPDSQIDTTYWLPWYNNVDLDTQLRFANTTAGTATVRVYIGGNEMQGSPFTLATGESTRKSFPGINAGPVQIESDQDIVAAERVIYKVNNVNTSFSEMMALPNSQLDTTYWLPWYNNVDLDTQLRFANVTDQTATVHVYIGGDEMQGSPFMLEAGASTRKNFPGINSGPVEIVSNQNIVAAERVIYKANKVNTSFTEMMALPNSQLDTTYWLPWYNNVDLDTQLRFANTMDTEATVHVFIGGVEMPNSPFTLAAGESTRKSFPGVNSGPVQIVSDQNIVAAERVIYKINGVNTSFTEMMALPDSLLDITYWLPWYNNVDLDTQLRFGVP